MGIHRRAVLILVLALVALPAAVALAKKEPVDIDGSAWRLDLKVQMKLKGVGGYKGLGEAMLYFGPNLAEDLDVGEFKLSNNEGDKYTGTWTDPKGKGSPILNFDVADIEDYLVDDVTEALEDEFMSVANVAIDITKMKVKCKVKPGKKASLSMKVNFIGSAVLEGEYMEGKGSFSAKGKGIET